MRRIDENTYIDDTLVTCAEYQLFIDEMREQGQYYQPDHWTTYQYPAGKAHEPILGIRHSDVVTFCRWLTKRGISDWCYRLPADAEAKEYLLEPDLYSMPLGYWNIGSQFQFFWIGPVPMDPRRIDIVRTFGLVHTANDRAFNSAIIRARTLDLDRTQNLKWISPLAVKSDIKSALRMNYPSENSSKIEREYTRRLARLNETKERIRNLKFTKYLARNQDRNLGHALKLSLDQVLDPNRDIDINSAFDLYIDIFTLQERIAGRSPAFEGIRLVKERIR